MVTPDRKVRKLMQEYQQTGNLTTASLRADPDQKTARKYLKSGKLPSDMKKEHTWRTRTASLFPNEASLLRLVTAVVNEISDEWEAGDVYLDVKGMKL